MRRVQATRLPIASSDVVRDINRRAVLNLIRTKAPVSRADLARLSGLQRSTISLIVEQLIRERWVLEGPTGRLPRGRRPTYLKLNEDRLIVGVDVRPTQTTVALAEVSGKFLTSRAFPTPPGPAEGVAGILEAIGDLRSASAGKTIEGLGLSLPGRLDADGRKLVFSPNLSWAGYDLRTPLEQATGLEVEMGNAAAACALAAAWFDHMDCNSLAVVTVSEGVGAGVFVEGRLARGRNGMAGEFGHIPVDLAGPACGCGGRGCWEVFSSNRAALRYYAEAGGPAEGLTFTGLLERADQGDTCAAGALGMMAYHLGRGMRLIVAALDPERILVIGDLTRSWERFGPVIQSHIEQQVLPGASAPVLTPVHEGGMARLRGTLALVLQRHFGVIR
jgi:predicted NBD/HSP70 family sugar kinase